MNIYFQFPEQNKNFAKNEKTSSKIDNSIRGVYPSSNGCGIRVTSPDVQTPDRQLVMFCRS